MNIEDPGQLIPWLRETGRISDKEAVRVEPLSGGVSNRVVRVFRTTGEDWVLKQALPRLRVQEEWRCPVHRIHREALGMRWLPLLVGERSIPKLLFEDHSHHVLAMEAVPVGFRNWKDVLLAGEISQECFAKAGFLLARLHAASRQRASNLASDFADRSFFELLRIDPFYRHTAANCPPLAAFLGELITTTRGHASGLVHGDFSPKNLLLSGSDLVLVDHEVIHWGDPMFDVGFVLAHFLSKAHARPELRPEIMAGSQAFWRAYQENLTSDAGGLSPESIQRGVWHGIGCLAARAAGKSPLSYLCRERRQRQIAMAVGLVRARVATMEDLLASAESAMNLGE